MSKLNSLHEKLVKKHAYGLLCSQIVRLTRAPHVGANARLQLHFENAKSKKGHNFVKRNWRITSPTGMGSPFDNEKLL